jgi:hypothetical protein
LTDRQTDDDPAGHPVSARADVITSGQVGSEALYR